MDTETHQSGSRLRSVLVSWGSVALLPLLSALLFGRWDARALQLPLHTVYLSHPGPSLAAFVVVGALILLAGGAVWRSIRPRVQVVALGRSWYRFPWWGWPAMFVLLLSWWLAWTRFPWFTSFQRFTFLPIWFSYVVLVNALLVLRDGASPLSDVPKRYLLLFFMSACFWWIFEWLNRFVLNWYYLNVQQFGAFEYACYASLAFSTVLPAVYATSLLLADGGRWSVTGSSFPLTNLGRWAGIGACGGLILLPIWPSLLYPLLWVGPLLLLIALLERSSIPHIFSGIRIGSYLPLVVWGGGALLCGALWEMWNAWSLAKWIYFIPYLDFARLFEMPLLGYLGYLPFGWLCAEITAIIFPEAFSPLGAEESSVPRHARACSADGSVHFFRRASEERRRRVARKESPRGERWKLESGGQIRRLTAIWLFTPRTPGTP